MNARSSVSVVVFSRAEDFDQKGVKQKVARACERATLAAARGADADLIVLGDLKIKAPSGCHQLTQRGDTFAERLVDGLERAALLGYERVVVVGTDTPELSAADIRRAVGDRDAVIGPSNDGGVYLFALSTEQLSVLAALPWGNAALEKSMRDKLGEHGRVSRLRALDDVDGESDTGVAIRALSSRVLVPSSLQTMPPVAREPVEDQVEVNAQTRSF